MWSDSIIPQNNGVEAVDLLLKAAMSSTQPAG